MLKIYFWDNFLCLEKTESHTLVGEMKVTECSLKTAGSKYRLFHGKLVFHTLFLGKCNFNLDAYHTKCNLNYIPKAISSSVGWAWRIHRPHPCIEVIRPQEGHGYNFKTYDGKAPIILMLWEMLSTYSMPSLPDTLWLGVVKSDGGRIYGSNRTVWHLNRVQTNDL